MHKLDYRNSYEWTGSFWFPDAQENKFAGKLTYTPEQGITLFIFNMSNIRLGDKQKLIMHGIIRHENNTVPVTLVELFFQSPALNISAVSSESVKGTVRVLLMDCLLDKFSVSGLYMDYDDNFYQFLFREKTISAVTRFLDKPAIIQKYKLFLTIVNARAQTIYSPDDFDDIICAFSNNPKRVIKKFKTYVEPFLEECKYSLLKRLETNIGIYIKLGYKKLSFYREFERIWRLYMEILLDYKININYCWISVQNKSTRYNKLCPALLEDFKPANTRDNKKMSHAFMPINLKAFALNDGLGTLNVSINKWFDIYKKPGWNNLIDGIKDIIYREHALIRQRDFVMLISYIETLQNLQGVPKSNDIDRFVTKNLSSKWIRKLNRLLEYKIVQDKNLGNCLCQVRNAMVHPKSQNKNKGKYYKIANNEVKLQNIYGILAGAFIKAFIKEIYDVSDAAIEKYADSFISTSSSYQYIKYTK